MAKKSNSSGRWLDEHFQDEYVQRAKKEGYRSRAVYKLIEIDKKDQLLKAGQLVLDLGAAPGGWTQYAAEKVTHSGHVVATDILPMDSFSDVTFVQGDFREQAVLDQILSVLNGEQADLVISDMAPNMSGVGAVDQPKGIYLVELALEMCKEVLKPSGVFLCKLFQGAGSDEFLKEVRQTFATVVIRKPKASRPRSREVYVLARQLKL
ncbi:MAG: 23S rRNA (uridine(2552)-2'-O)-methyltransferase RlmE [Gammaproteobacteria bacterium]|nr:23S rRNA (uridine(2552)-2'-O)-methyltransferase RlmE [Gammaproteobacteria bacterium]